MKLPFVISLFISVCLCQLQSTTTSSGNTTEACLNLFDTESAYFYAIMNHFNGLFFGDFITGGSKGIYGPLAVGGTATIPLYSIDKNIYVDCNSSLELDRLGFSAGTLSSPASLYVAGDVITGNQPDYEFLVFGDPECSVKNESSAPFQFDALYSKASYISEYFAGLPPTHRLVGDTLEEVSLSGVNDPQFYVLQFGPCQISSCQSPTEFISDASQIFLGDNSWNGPINGYPDHLSIIFNIGIVGGEEFIVTTGFPNAGLSACRAFFNFYSVNSDDGSFSDQEITLVRDGQGFWGGTIMNLWGGIIDGPDGNFGGQLVGKDYSWLYEDDGADILDYFEIGETCTAKSTCWLPVYTDDLGESESSINVGITVGVSTTVFTVTETTTDTSFSISTAHSTATTEATVTSTSVSYETEYSVTSTTTTTLTFETTTLATSTGTRTTTAISTETVTVTAFMTTEENTTTETTTTEDVTVEDTTTETVSVTDHATAQTTLHYLVTDVVVEDTTENTYETVTLTDLTSIQDYYTTTTTTTIAVTTYYPPLQQAIRNMLLG